MGGLIVDKAVIRDAALRSLNKSYRDSFNENDHPREGGKFTAKGGGEAHGLDLKPVEHSQGKVHLGDGKGKATSKYAVHKNGEHVGDITSHLAMHQKKTAGSRVATSTSHKVVHKITYKEGHGGTAGRMNSHIEHASPQKAAEAMSRYLD